MMTAAEFETAIHQFCGEASIYFTTKLHAGNLDGFGRAFGFTDFENLIACRRAPDSQQEADAALELLGKLANDDPAFLAYWKRRHPEYQEQETQLDSKVIDSETRYAESLSTPALEKKLKSLGMI
jgi:hypothetical protein